MVKCSATHCVFRSEDVPAKLLNATLVRSWYGWKYPATTLTQAIFGLKLSYSTISDLTPYSSPTLRPSTVSDIFLQYPMIPKTVHIASDWYIFS